MREMLLRVFAVAIAATLLFVPAYAQQSHWSSANDKTAKYIIESETVLPLSTAANMLSAKTSPSRTQRYARFGLTRG